ncbi:conserved hypothetical protein [Ricinus communis]|uniref:Uncharacterized protein n=1 Tax=Ricinus communis TaxID=3988 RepID=B9S345_RICCO|nr:conserved hypothetical protein [Ricinus communis]
MACFIVDMQWKQPWCMDGQKLSSRILILLRSILFYRHYGQIGRLNRLYGKCLVVGCLS